MGRNLFCMIWVALFLMGPGCTSSKEEQGDDTDPLEETDLDADGNISVEGDGDTNADAQEDSNADAEDTNEEDDGEDTEEDDLEVDDEENGDEDSAESEEDAEDDSGGDEEDNDDSDGDDEEDVENDANSDTGEDVGREEDTGTDEDTGAELPSDTDAPEGTGTAESTEEEDTGAGFDGDPLDTDDVVTGPEIVDPEEMADGLPKYYISNNGNDDNSGTSPEDAWATVENVPNDQASAVYFEKGGEFTAVGAPARGRNGPAAFNAAEGSVWSAYGEGDERPILRAEWQTQDRTTGAVLSPGGNSLIEGISITGQANFGILIMTDGNIIQNCEIDGNLDDSFIELGFSVRGHNNLVVGNTIQSLHEVILDSGNVNTSGGAEGIVVNGTNHEIAYNTLIDLWTPNETLGGAEGGCLEIIARAPGEVAENIVFHHNYCERSVGLFEACAGNFEGTQVKIQEEHALVRNTTLAYNVSMDAMWLYLIQTANTDFDGLVFEHNTLVHSAVNDEIPQRGAPGFGNFYDTDKFMPEQSCSSAADCGNGGENRQCFNNLCYYQFPAQPGTITVRNNFFVVLEGSKDATMKPPPGDDDFVNNVFSPKAPQGVQANRATIVTDPGLVDNTFRITADSPVIDQASADAIKPWIDFDDNAVPCGGAPDIGAIEFCP